MTLVLINAFFHAHFIVHRKTFLCTATYGKSNTYREHAEEIPDQVKKQVQPVSPTWLVTRGDGIRVRLPPLLPWFVSLRLGYRSKWLRPDLYPIKCVFGKLSALPWSKPLATRVPLLATRVSPTSQSRAPLMCLGRDVYLNATF